MKRVLQQMIFVLGTHCGLYLNYMFYHYFGVPLENDTRN